MTGSAPGVTPAANFPADERPGEREDSNMARYEVKRTVEEIDDLLNAVIEDEGPRFPGMTFEQGLKDGIDWVTGETDEHPLGE
jgi:hypothetical protein